PGIDLRLLVSKTHLFVSHHSSRVGSGVPRGGAPGSPIRQTSSSGSLRCSASFSAPRDVLVDKEVQTDGPTRSRAARSALNRRTRSRKSGVGGGCWARARRPNSIHSARYFSTGSLFRR